MSKENVALFIKAANKNEDLIRQITKKDRTADWVAVAQKAGYEFTAAEFAEVVSDTLGRPTTPDNAVREYLLAQNSMAKGEMSQAVLEGVVGGTAAFVKCNPLFVRGGTGPKPIEKAI
jgi:hypothetical protein